MRVSADTFCATKFYVAKSLKITGEDKKTKINVPTLYKKGTLLVAQLVEALLYKPEVRGFDSRLCHWTFSLT